MRLTFNILCFEDRHDFAVKTLEFLKTHLDEQGFYLNTVDICKDSEKLEEIVQKVNEKKLDVDLILMDYKLANKQEGNKLIEDIRSHKLLTDIIFYSVIKEKNNIQGYSITQAYGGYKFIRDTTKINARFSTQPASSSHSPLQPSLGQRPSRG